MKILIVTHVFLWKLAWPEKRNSNRRYLLESPRNEVFLSAMSVTELMIKASIGKLEINFNPVEMAGKMAVQILNVTGNDALPLKELRVHHKDPLDRMIIAQAVTHQLKLMSDDGKFSRYDCHLI